VIQATFLVARIVKWILDFIFKSGERDKPLAVSPQYLQVIAQYHPVMRRCRFCVTVVENRQLKQSLSFTTTMCVCA